MLKGESLPNLKSLLWLSISGILMLFVGNGSVAWIEQYLPSGLAAIIVATVPLWFVILDKRQWSYHFSNKLIIVGLLIGFAGVLVLFWGKGAAAITGDKMKLISFFILIIGTIGWTVGSLISKYKKTEGSTSVKVAVQMLSASTVAFFCKPVYREKSVQHTPGFFRIIMGTCIPNHNGIACCFYGVRMAIECKASLCSRNVCLCQPNCSSLSWMANGK